MLSLACFQRKPDRCVPQVGFVLDDEPDNAQMVAWTTTPWTLPSNLSLCVHPEMTYVRVRHMTCFFLHLEHCASPAARMGDLRRFEFCKLAHFWLVFAFCNR